MNKAALPPIPSKEIDLNSDTTIEPGLAQCFIAALEIALDQLSILEDIPPKISGTENKQLVQRVRKMLNEQQILKETLEDKKIEAGKLPSKDLDDIIEDLSCRISTLTKDMSRYLILGLAKTLKNPAAAQNLIKVQEERIDLQKLFSRIIDELEDGRFDSLVEAVREGRKDSVALEDILKKEADGLDTLKRLQDELAYEKRLLEEEINDGARAIQQLKDTIVEVNALTISEQKYVVKAVKAREETVKLVCAAKESQLSNEESIIAAKIEEEKLVHDKMMSFLSSQQIALSTSVEEWMIKYETDTEAKAQELEQARIKSLEDAEAYKNLKAEYDALEKIAEEHRLIAQQELLEKQLNRQKKRAAIKIQRWYRKIYGKRSAMKSGGSEKIGKNKGKDKKSPKKAKKK